MSLPNRKLLALCLVALAGLFALQFVLSEYMVLALTRILILAIFAMGYNLLIQSEAISNNIATAALMHHERFDGSGYPMGKKGNDIGFCSSVVAVADVYDAVTSTRVYSTKRSPYIAAEILWEESFCKLDPRIAKVFYDKITNFYVGNEVLLSNNERGLVIYVDPYQPTRPVVMVGDKFYDLNRDRSLTIMEIID